MMTSNVPSSLDILEFQCALPSSRKIKSKEVKFLGQDSTRIECESSLVAGLLFTSASCNKKLQMSTRKHITTHLDTKSPNAFAFGFLEKQSFLKAELSQHIVK